MTVAEPDAACSRRFRVPVAKAERFKQLGRVPTVAAPTLAALVVAAVGLPLVAVARVTGALPAWAASACATARRHLVRALPHLGVTLAVIALLVHAGYAREVVLLWLVPSRLTFVIAGCLFFWLPHVGAETTADEDVLRSTTIRLGHEWLLAPLLQFHNYHLVHHLFPGLPSRCHEAAYRLLAEELHARPLLVQRGFAVRPELSGAAR